MSEIKFPKRRLDGSFRVIARFKTTADVSGLMAEYVRVWARATPVWVRYLALSLDRGGAARICGGVLGCSKR